MQDSRTVETCKIVMFGTWRTCEIRVLLKAEPEAPYLPSYCSVQLSPTGVYLSPPKGEHLDEHR
jgi:hypothetical protein